MSAIPQMSPCDIPSNKDAIIFNRQLEIGKNFVSGLDDKKNILNYIDSNTEKAIGSVNGWETCDDSFAYYCGFCDKYLNSKFSVLIVPRTVSLYKGIDKVKCEDVKNPHSPFDFFQQKPIWLSSIYVAKQYAIEKVHCYTPIRPLVLMELTDPVNIKALVELIYSKIEKVDSRSTEYHLLKSKYDEQLCVIAKATGCGLSSTAHRKLLNIPINQYKVDAYMNLPASTIKRVSFTDIDACLADIIKEHIPFVDGYYGREIDSPFHDVFHEEVCIFGSNGKLTKNYKDVRLCKNAYDTTGGKQKFDAKKKTKNGGGDSPVSSIVGSFYNTMLRTQQAQYQAKTNTRNNTQSNVVKVKSDLLTTPIGEQNSMTQEDFYAKCDLAVARMNCGMTGEIDANTETMLSELKKGLAAGEPSRRWRNSTTGGKQTKTKKTTKSTKTTKSSKK